MTEKIIQAIDLFCGAGGSSYGATRAGVNVVAGFDMWDLALKTYGSLVLSGVGRTLHQDM